MDLQKRLMRSTFLMKKNKFKKGDKIVEFGHVFKVFDIKRQKNSNGEFEKVLYFRPYFESTKTSAITCSIPVNNVEKTLIRRIITRKELRELTKKLKKKNIKNEEEFPAINIVKALLDSNDPADTVRVLRILWREKSKKTETFSKSKRDVFNLAMDRLVQEFALISGASLEDANQKIRLSLQG